MIQWEEQVSKIEMKEFVSFDDKYDYVACFDENGSASAILQMFKSVVGNALPPEDRRYFTLTCCLFSREDYLTTKCNISDLKDKYFSNYNEPVVLHTREIVKKLGPFHFENNEMYGGFISDLSKTIDEAKCKIISVTFDLYSYVKQNYKYDPYEVAFDIILQGLYKNVPPQSRIALVFESRGKNEDKSLYKHFYKILYVTGCKNTKKRILQEYFDEAYFNHKVSQNGLFAYPGIEIADLCSYPIYRFMRFGTQGKDFEIVKNKIVKAKNGHPVGLRKFPTNWLK